MLLGDAGLGGGVARDNLSDDLVSNLLEIVALGLDSKGAAELHACI